jgi:CRISPR-associated endonuclease/helicase Cas3
MPDNLYAHTHPSASWEPLECHLRAVAGRAGAFAGAFGAADLAQAAGLLHDVGKASARFQAYLHGQGPSVDHSTAGARLACERYGMPLGKLLAFAVAGHHAGLPDGAGDGPSLALRLKKRIEPHDRWTEAAVLPVQLGLPSPTPREGRQGFQLAFLTRMLFSCLVDADRLETERFMEGREREAWPELLALRPRLKAYLAQKAAAAAPSEVNRQRARILAHVRAQASLAPGLFSLTVPTGGGKTLTSLAFALDHAEAHGLRRVIYVIPFTSVVEQTADVFRAALGSDSMLEHHSAFDPGRLRQDLEEEERPSGEERHRQAAENWDARVVVTTAVQLFESLFAARPARCRKLHNLAGSVIVLDEAQTLPLHLLKPCVAVLDELALNYGASIVLMTATQPALNDPDLKGGLTGVRELAPPHLDLEPAFRRVAVRHHAEPLDDAALAARLRAERQALCIVNSRRHARELYEAIKDEGDAFHLSTFMCAAHRRVVLEDLRERLRTGAPVRLVATSLIEAGVDISFPLVLRAEAGLDQVAQAAGRCNREGELSGLGLVELFASAAHKPMPEIEQRAAAGRSALRRHPEEPLGKEAIALFFREMHLLRGDAALDAKQILEAFAERAQSLDFPFATVAELFAMIEDRMVPVIIPYDGKARALIAELEHAPFVGRAARGLQRYTAQVPRSARGLLLSAQAARSVREADYPGQFVVLENQELYRSDLGLTWDDPTFRAAEGLVF